VPVQRSQGEPLGGECIHVQPRPPSQIGMKNAVRPRDWRSTSLTHAPKRPTQLPTAWGQPRPRRYSKRGRAACQVASGKKQEERGPSAAARRERCSRGGFAWAIGRSKWVHGFALPAFVRSEICREQAEGADKESQSSLYYRCAGGGLRAKHGRGEPWCGPPFPGLRVQGSGISCQFSETWRVGVGLCGGLLQLGLRLSKDIDAALDSAVVGQQGRVLLDCDWQIRMSVDPHSTP